MSAEFLRGINKLANTYGMPLNDVSDTHKFAFYMDSAHIAENDLAETATIGKTVTGAYIVKNAVAVVQVTMLNESFGLMPDYGNGNLIGDVAITTRLAPEKNEDEFTQSVLDLDFCLYASGKVELAYASRDSNDPEIRDIYAQAGAHPIQLVPQKGSLYPGIQNNHCEELSFQQNRFLNPTQITKLRNFVIGAFIEI